MSTGHEWIGRKTKRILVGANDAGLSIVDGEVIEWWPKGAGKDDPAMWKVKFISSILLTDVEWESL